MPMNNKKKLETAYLDIAIPTKCRELTVARSIIITIL